MHYLVSSNPDLFDFIIEGSKAWYSLCKNSQKIRCKETEENNMEHFNWVRWR